MAADDDPSPGRTVDARVIRTRNDVVAVALRVLVDEGWEGFTQPRVAQISGYSKATVYKHWPTRTHLLRDALHQIGDMPHHVPTGDLRIDLVEELKTFRDAMAQMGLDRALAVLVDRAMADPEVAALRVHLVGYGEQVLRQLLGEVLEGERLDAAVMMIAGATLYSALMHGRIPADAVIETTVDLVLRATENDPEAGVRT